MDRGEGLIIAGTDTGVGKTLVAAGLTAWAREQGFDAVAVKPVETGCPVRDGELIPEDGAILRRAGGDELTLDECAPFRFSLPASAFRAAAMENRKLRLEDMAEHVMAVAERKKPVIVEGAGGLLVPIEEGLFMIDFFVRLPFPVLLVGRTALGTVNHTLLSVEALRSRGKAPIGVVLCRMSDTPGPEEEYTASDIARLVPDIGVMELPCLPDATARDPSEIALVMSEKWSSDTLARWIGIR